MADLLSIIKQAAMDAVENSKPTAVLYGTVRSTAPLSIFVDQKMTLSKEFLIVPESLTTHRVTTTTEENETKTVTIHAELNVGDHVALLRVQGGQRFLVLDRTT